MKYIVICDIDGTIAKHTEEARGHFEYEKCYLDEPVPDIIELLNEIHFEGAHIIFMTGREDRVRDMTEEWLNRHTAVNGYELFMRPTGDHRKDAIVKSELFRQNVMDRKENIWFVLEDRDQMVAMWRHEFGFTVLQVAEGNF